MSQQLQPGDIYTMDVPDLRLWVRAWCWITGRPAPVRREAFKVTHVTTAGGWVAVR